MTFKRYEIKYLITTEQKALLLNEIKPFMDADIHGKSTILSLYLDTPDFLLVRRSLDKPIYKEKLRLRSYGTAQPDTDVFIELKKKYDSVVYKRRETMKLFELESYLKTGIMPKDTQIMREIDFAMKHLKDWAKEKRVKASLAQMPGKGAHDRFRGQRVLDEMFFGARFVQKGQSLFAVDHDASVGW